MRILGVIPARGGSKGILRKNVRMVGGSPLIAWTVGHALESAVLDRVICTTDDEEIADLALLYGAEVPFRRPVELATDTARSSQAVRHCLEWLADNEGYYPDYVMILYPTGPLRNVQDICAVASMADAPYWESVASVVEVTHNHPRILFKIGRNGELESYLPIRDEVRARWRWEPYVVPNGSIWITSRRNALAEDWYAQPCRPYLMPEERSVNVDTEWDLQVVDWALRARTKGGNR